jgi:predicted Zn-dependent protease
MLTREQAQKLAEKVLSYSKFPECSVSVTSSEQAFTRFANNGITTAALVSRHSVTIRATREGRSGSIVVTDVSDSELQAAVRRAEELAAIAPPDPEHQKPLGPQRYPETNDHDEKTAAARAPEMIPQIRAGIETAQKQKMVAAGLFERTTAHSAIANKEGLFGFHRSADAKLTTTIRAADGSSSGWAGQPSTRIAEISGAALAEAAAAKCARWKKPRRLEPGRYTVVFEPTATGDIVHQLAFGGFRGDSGGAFSARMAEEGRSFLSKRGGGTRLGEKMFPEFVTLRTDPFDPRLPSAPWTNELLPARKISWIENGAVANLALDRYWAEKTGRAATPSPDNLILEGGSAGLDELIRSVERGLLVTHFWYIRFVNVQTQQYTGLTRDGLFLIENGKVADPVMNLRFNDGPVHLLQKTVRLGKAVRMRGLEGATMIAPALVAEDFNFTSTSEAV